jgi:nucleoside phosphorylase
VLGYDVGPMKSTHPGKSNIPARLSSPSSAGESEFSAAPNITHTPALPPVNWGAVGAQAPILLSTPADTLPEAAVVVLVWTEAEWASLEHVFCSSAAAMPYANRNTGSWSGWQTYSEDVPAVAGWTFWGEYRLVQIGTSNVLLFKSNTHLDFPGESYLQQLISRLIATAKPQLILSTGTAGGARPTDHIGTVNVVRAGTLYESGQPQASWPEYTSPWTANWSLLSTAGFGELLFPVPTVAADLASLCSQFNTVYKSDYPLSTLNVGGLDMADPSPLINDMTAGHTSLLTADSFVVGTSSGNLGAFACVEMDDAVIAETCVAANVAFGSVRNISDPVQNASLPPAFQAHWGQTVYDAYGFYTSYNGAVAAWAILSAQLRSAQVLPWVR